jgi:hypothetical protein
MPRRVGKSWRAVAGLAFVADAKSVRARAVAPSDSIECFRMMLRARQFARAFAFRRTPEIQWEDER